MAMSRLQGKVVAVTGAASGIGRAIITAFAREGATCVIVDTDYEWAESVAENLRSAGANISTNITDISSGEQVDAMIESIIGNHGGLDIIVNNAGVGVHKEVIDLSEEEWDYQVDVQLKGVFLCSRAAAQRMIARGNGKRIINIGSTAAVNGRIAAAPHCVSKAGVVMLTQVMALELGRY